MFKFDELAHWHVARSVLEACDDGIGQVAMLHTDLDRTFDRVKHDDESCVTGHVTP